MLWLQEGALRRRDFHAWLRVLPPLTELETLLFRTNGVGFVLLTATLLTGVLFVDDLFAQHLVHKTVLSILSWLAFGALLIGRWRWGWRGAVAARWTLAAMELQGRSEEHTYELQSLMRTPYAVFCVKKTKQQ